MRESQNGPSNEEGSQNYIKEIQNSLKIIPIPLVHITKGMDEIFIMKDILFSLNNNLNIRQVITKDTALNDLSIKIQNKNATNEDFINFHTKLAKIMLEKYRLWLIIEPHLGKKLFTIVEPFEDPNWKSIYIRNIKDGEPILPNQIKFYRSSESSGVNAQGMTFDKNILLFTGEIEKEYNQIKQIQWIGKTDTFLSPKVYENSIVANELASIAFDAKFSEFNINLLNGKKYNKTHVSEFYSDIISSRVDIREIRRIIAQSTGSSISNYTLTDDLVNEYIQKEQIKDIKSQMKNYDFLRNLQIYLENRWLEVITFLNSSPKI